MSSDLPSLRTAGQNDQWTALELPGAGWLTGRPVGASSYETRFSSELGVRSSRGGWWLSGGASERADRLEGRESCGADARLAAVVASGEADRAHVE